MNGLHRRSALLLMGIILLLAPTSAPGAEDPALDAALKQLDTLDWEQSLDGLQPIDRAARAARQANDSQACQSLEARLLPVLEGAAPRAAKDYVCRQLALIGSAAAVPVLARLLPDAELAHMARTALEAIDDPSAVAALRTALRQTSGRPQVGVVQSLGTLRDAECVPALADIAGIHGAGAGDGRPDRTGPDRIRRRGSALGTILDPRSGRTAGDADSGKTGRRRPVGRRRPTRPCCQHLRIVVGRRQRARAGVRRCAAWSRRARRKRPLC